MLRSAQQLRFSQEPDWLCEKPVQNGQVRTQSEFSGVVSREEPAVRTCIETRRKDVGYQIYSTGTYEPTFVVAPIQGTVPTASAFFFLRDEYPDSSKPTPPNRYFR